MSLAGAGEAGHIHHLAVEEPTSLRSSPWPQVTGKPEAQCLRCSSLHTQDPGRSQSAGTTQRNCDVGEYACSFLCFSNSYLTSLVLHCLNRQTHPKGRCEDAVEPEEVHRGCSDRGGALCGLTGSGSSRPQTHRCLDTASPTPGSANTTARPGAQPTAALWWWPQTKGKPQPTRMVSLSTGPSSPSRSLRPQAGAPPRIQMAWSCRCLRLSTRAAARKVAPVSSSATQLTQPRARDQPKRMSTWSSSVFSCRRHSASWKAAAE